MKSLVSRFLVKCRAHRRGQSMILFAAVMPVLVGICGLSIDAGNLYLQRRTLQGIADAAAMAGAQNANFDRQNPAVLEKGLDTALKAAKANGAVLGGTQTIKTRATTTSIEKISIQEGEVEVKRPAERGKPYPMLDGKEYPDAHIQIVVTRTVSNPFMGLFGLGTAQIQAWSVARCFMPGFGDAAIIALSTDPAAISFNGGAGGLYVTGDLVSYGGIKSTMSSAGHFLITGSAYSYGAEAATGLTFLPDDNGTPLDPSDDEPNGAYGATQSSQLPQIYDPVTQGIANGTFSWPQPEVTIHPYGWTYGSQAAAKAVVWCDSGVQCGDANAFIAPGGPVDEDCDSPSDRLEIKNNEDAAIFYPGTYICEITINSGTVVFEPGMYIFKKTLSIKGGTISSVGPNLGVPGKYGVLFRLDGGVAVDMSAGSANLTLHPYSETILNGTNVEKKDNTWKNIIFYAPTGDVDVTGSGDRSINGSIYAPLGAVKIAGNGSGSAIQDGQVIAQTVTFSGNGPAVYFDSDEADATFGPVLLNKPD